MISGFREELMKKSLKHQYLNNIISFTDDDVRRIQTSHNDAIVVSMTVVNYDVKKILVDNESSVDVLFYDVLLKIGLIDRLRPVCASLVGFSRNSVPIEEKVTLLVTAGHEPRQSIVPIIFMVVKILSAYNAILGRPALNVLRAIVSTYHLLVRFLTKNGVGEMKGDQIMAR